MNNRVSGGGIHSVVGSGATVNAAARKELEEDDALLAEVNAMPLPPPASATTGIPSASGSWKAASEKSGVDGGDGENGSTLVSALGALAKQRSGISIPLSISGGQQVVSALIDGALWKALTLQGRMRTTEGCGKEYWRLVDSID